MADQRNVVTYELDVQTGAAQMALSQVLQTAKGTLFAGLGEPIETALRTTGEMGAQQGRMLDSQRMASGWANFQAAAQEYTQRGFYQQMAFGTQPQFGAAGLRNEMMIQQMVAGMPFQAGIPTSAAEMRHFSDMVTQPTQGLLGFQRPFGEVLQGAMAGGLQQMVAGPGQLATAIGQLQGLTPFAQGYGATAEAGALYTRLLAQGVPLQNAQATTEEVIRAQAAGVPTQQALGAVSRYEQDTRSRQMLGLLGPQGRAGYSAANAVDDQITAENVNRQFMQQGFGDNPEAAARFGRSLEELNLMFGNDGAQRQRNVKTAMSLTYGAMAKNVDTDLLAGQETALNSRRDAEEERTASMQKFKNAFYEDRKTLISTVFRTALDKYAPEGVRKWADNVMGYGADASSAESGMLPALDMTGRIAVSPFALDIATGKLGGGDMRATPAGKALQDAEAKRKSKDLVGALSSMQAFMTSGDAPKDLRASLERAAGGASWLNLLGRAVKTGDFSGVSLDLAAPKEEAMERTLREYVGAPGTSKRIASMAGIEGAAQEQAGLNVFGTADMRRQAGRLELDVMSGTKSVQAARKEFIGIAGGDKTAIENFTNQLSQLAVGKESGEETRQMQGLRNFGDVQTAKAMLQDPDLMGGVKLTAITALSSAQGKGDKYKTLISQIEKIGSGDAGALDKYRGLMENAPDKRAGQLLQTALSSQISTGQTAPQTPDFGNFSGALVSAADALRLVVKNLPAGLTPAKQQS